MKKLHLLKTILLLCALIVGSNTLWAVDVVYKTALFGSSNNSQGISNYTSSWYSTTDGFRVDIENFSNNNNGWDYVKCGRNGYESTATIITNAAIDKAVTKVSIKIDAITTSKITSITLYTSTNGSGWTSAGTYTKGTGTKEVSLSSPTVNLYYKLEFVCASGTSNGLCTISEVKYYVVATSPIITADDVELEYNDAEGEITYSLENPVDGAEVTATSEDGWISNISVNESTKKVTFNTTENEGKTDREGTITIYYKKGGETLTSKEVTVTQAPYDLKDPVFSPVAGVYNTTQSVAISCDTEGSAIYYTLDGTTPTTSSTPYSSAISVENSSTIKAVSYKESHYSNVITATYIIDPSLNTKTWDLSTDETTSASTTSLTWVDSNVSMDINKASSTTNANNYYPGTAGQSYTSTRFYKDMELTITPATSNLIKRIVFTAASASYANVLRNSTWVNATADVSGTTVTITPINGGSNIAATIAAVCGFTEVKVYYSTAENITIGTSKYASFCSSRNLDFTSSDVKAYTARVEENEVKLTKINKVPRDEGVVLYCETPGIYNIPVIASASEVSGNEMVGVTERTYVPWTSLDGEHNYILQQGQFNKATDGYLKANRAYLHTTFDVTSVGAQALSIVFDDEETTTISEVKSKKAEVSGDYFDLQGRKVAQPTKGLYIVNGRKVLVK